MKVISDETEAKLVKLTEERKVDFFKVGRREVFYGLNEGHKEEKQDTEYARDHQSHENSLIVSYRKQREEERILNYYFNYMYQTSAPVAKS